MSHETNIDTDRYWADVPSVDDEPGDTKTRRGMLTSTAPSRRTMLKGVGVLGGALALNVLSVLPPFKTREANAAVGSEWLHCAGYNNWSGYDNNSKLCVGGTYSRSYCGADGWFKRSSGTCYNSYAVVACGTGSYGKKNAWRWTHSGTPYRCADGNVATCGGTYFYICSWSNP
ncbi:hypothetical protein AB0B45_14590 [Nonomuraea sp. NPDC049152]|uniref:hypothetical protein n=1 Tax=Nonomuraea sp. NPDC049152 TaxID=3154350 RepID=UPI0033D90163